MYLRICIEEKILDIALPLRAKTSMSTFWQRVFEFEPKEEQNRV